MLLFSRKGLSTVLTVMLVAGIGEVTAEVAQAAPYSMTGQMWMGNPSAGITRQKALAAPVSVSQTGVPVTQPGLGSGAGRTLMIPQGVWNLTGVIFRTFMDFPTVAQLTTSFTTTHMTATFKVSSGAGNTAWCPRVPNCQTFTQGTAAQGLISYAAGPNQFGGTFKQLRDLVGNVYFVPRTAAPISISQAANPRGHSGMTDGGGTPGVLATGYWGAGLTNQRQIIDPNNTGRIYVNGTLTTSGAIANLGTYQDVARTACGTPPCAPFNPPDGYTTGFKMTTGSIFVIDATPQGVQNISGPGGRGGLPRPTWRGQGVTTMDPALVSTTASPFSFTTSGTDQRTANGAGNIVLVGGSIAYAGVTGNIFFRNTRIDMTLPEPGMTVGLASCVLALLGLARLRRWRS
jgi:hypothetical protein